MTTPSVSSRFIDMETTTNQEARMPALNPTTITELAARAADIAETDGGLVASITMGEMADGSRRAYALVETQDNGLDQTYRVSSPALAGAPRWAHVYTHWSVEVRIGDDWMELEPAA